MKILSKSTNWLSRNWLPIYLTLMIAILVFGVACNAESTTYYSNSLKGRLMANGKPYDPGAYTCASYDYPFGTVLKVTYEDRSILVRVTDRHDFKTDLDLSIQAFYDLTLCALYLGRIETQVEVVK